MTDAERLLWSRVRNEQLGSKFRRQVPIGPYIADFTCASARLVVELDGGQHNESPHDALRDAFLQQEGYKVLRFWNNDVLAHVEGVLMSIQAALEEPKDQTPPPNLPQELGEERTALRNTKHAPPNLPQELGEERTALRNTKHAPPNLPQELGEERTALRNTKHAPPNLPQELGEERTALRNTKHAPPNLPQELGEEKCAVTPSPPVGRVGVGRLTTADPLAPLRTRLAARYPACDVRWIARTGSTNADLLAEARAGRLDGPTLLATGEQTAGRGRQGRVWADDAQSSVLCSLAWPDPRKREPGPLSLAVGVWLARALHALGASQVRLKWPNDLLLPAADGAGGWRKLGGILVEMADTPQARWAVIGFGLNLRAPAGQSQAAGLDSAGLDLQRSAVLAVLVPALLDGLQQAARVSQGNAGPPQVSLPPGPARERPEGAAPLAATLAQWDALHAWNGQRVSVQDRGQTLFSGTALGIAPDGALRVGTPEGERRVLSADVSLRLSEKV